jgi:hypothetical protein
MLLKEGANSISRQSALLSVSVTAARGSAQEPGLWEQQLELELIQTHMTQKPVLRIEVGVRVRALF